MHAPRRIVRAALVFLAFLIVLTAAEPFAYSATGDVTAQVSLNGPSVACNHTIYGVVKVTNNLGTAIEVLTIELTVLDNPTGRAYHQESTAQFTVGAHSTQGVDFAFTSLIDVETQNDPEPAQVNAYAIYIAPDGSHVASGVGSAGLSITGCSKATPASTQQSSSSSQQISTGSSQQNNIPEFPLQPLAIVGFVLVMVSAYVLARRREVAVP